MKTSIEEEKRLFCWAILFFEVSVNVLHWQWILPLEGYDLLEYIVIAF